jgi:rfaE bifunctional protein kinase chain/domain
MTIEVSDKIKSKIVDVAYLRNLIGSHPRVKRVALCHGVFDVVHPGHIRHFLYVKSKAPVLVVSLTSDRFINKGNYRPHVPQDLRAINLAILEIVDYVVIDDHETPINEIQILEPDFFAKGYEYDVGNQKNLRTEEEVSVVESYGGSMLFTPGDFVLSSSRFIQDTPPNLKLEKLDLLMSRSRVTFDDLRKTLANMNKCRVHVVGDLIVDSYTTCSLLGGQTKTPTLSVRYEDKKDLVGGAGIVAAHLSAAGAKTHFSCVTGEDDLGARAVSELRELDIHVQHFIDPNRPTTNKNAILVGDYRLIKIDTVDSSAIPRRILDSLIEDVRNSKASSILFSDFRHGIFNKGSIPKLIKAIPKTVLKVADSQVASRWGNILDFKNFDLITPNEREARFSLGDQDSSIRSLASSLFEKSGCRLLILKLGDRGIITSRSSDAATLEDYFVMDSFVDKLIDPVGAGDALLAYATLGLMVSSNQTIASILGNLAAAVECEVDGNVPVTPTKLNQKIDQIEDALNFR